jgi:hypothetical protein
VYFGTGTNLSDEPAAFFMIEEKMKVAGSFKTLVPFYQTTWHHIPGEHNHNNHWHENFKTKGAFLSVSSYT